MEEKIEIITNIIYPHLKNVDDNITAYKLAEQIINKLEEEPPTWYIHG